MKYTSKAIKYVMQNLPVWCEEKKEWNQSEHTWNRQEENVVMLILPVLWSKKIANTLPVVAKHLNACIKEQHQTICSLQIIINYI